MDSIKYLQHKPFLAFFTGLLDSRHFKEPSAVEPIKVLEVGCGPGHFSALLKEQYQDRIDVTAIDPSEEDIQLCADHKANVKYMATTVLDMDLEQYRESFDVILFSKSLHHCDPLDGTIDQVHRFLKKKGVVVAEEFDRSAITEESARWYFDRVDLLMSGNHLVAPTNKSENMQKKWHAMMDPTMGSPLERWQAYFSHHHHHHHHHHGHGHGHGDAHSDDHHHHQQEGHYKHGLQGEDLSTAKAINASLKRAFGTEVKVVSNNPFLHGMIVFQGLEDSSVGRAVLETFMTQEITAIKEGKLKGVGATAPTIRKKNAVYQNNVNKRGHVKSSLVKEEKGFKFPVSYWVLGVLAFALLGGAILQVIDLFL
ncbi:S-adenosyl-L-methionine-dependent methyltransferase [Zychaea mexicana]|uniref:S-adenosyl-L-methionine-dependent methyltransferase n=1 Tax=Zychaea mexicana TaxID=64656 RepID=UPI0022FEF929|nr:S-adenosyl-L-methionine-dependent methyltransferase [Zychaea mexicana]KAI9489182.1 S-adenosyl-L-methionine-dependent methyltransferase [Zychaea mexicana]